LGELVIGGVMSTALAGPSENIHHALKRLLEKFGMKKEKAEDTAIMATYLGIPQLIAAAGSVILGHKAAQR
jgi:hypothetical protein